MTIIGYLVMLTTILSVYLLWEVVDITFHWGDDHKRAYLIKCYWPKRGALHVFYTFFMFLSCPLQSSCMKCWNLGLYRECWYVNCQCFSVFFKLVAVPAKWFTFFYYILLAQQCCVHIKFQFFFWMDVSFSNQHFG